MGNLRSFEENCAFLYMQTHEVSEILLASWEAIFSALVTIIDKYNDY